MKADGEQLPRPGRSHSARFRSALPHGAYSVKALAVERAGDEQHQAVAGKLMVRWARFASRRSPVSVREAS